VSNVFFEGSLVCIANYSPFHGRKGIIRKVDCIFDDSEEPFCFYLVALEGTQIKEPLWFEYDEVELVTSPLVTSQAETLFIQT
jgi:hypothetical protein